jgi:iron complex outermembrane receptor protein
MKTAIVAAFGVMAVMAANGQEASDSARFDMEEVVVTATPKEQKAKDVAAAVSVVDSVEIEASNADYVMDVIGSLPGVYIRRDAILGRQDIEIRGLGSNLRRLQTLVDGRPEKMSLFGCTVAQTLPLSNVERIEVIRGPESVLYGTDAMGGVVNIVTRRKWDPGFESSALLSYGSYDTFHGLLRHGGLTNRFDYYLTYDHKQSEGHRDNSAYVADFVSLRTGYDLDSGWRIEMSGQYFEDEAEDPGPENDPYTSDDKKEYLRYSWDADLKRQWEDSQVHFTVYNNEGEHEFDMPSVNDFWHSKDRTVGVLSRYTWNAYESERATDDITMGYEYKYQWAEPQQSWVDWAKANMPARFMDFGPYERNNHDVYAFNEFSAGRWTQTLGLRAHWDDQDESWEPVPQAGLLFHIGEQTTARAKVAKAFRQPRFSELHLFPAHNEELDPEELWSYEIALVHALSPDLSVFVNPFYMDVGNFIQQESNESPPPRFVNSNSGDFYIRGVEAGVDSRIARHLTLTCHYTYTDIEDGPAGNVHLNREGKPEHVFNAVADYKMGRTSLSLEGEHIAGLYDSNLLAGGDIEEVDDFTVFDLKATRRVAKGLRVFVSLENLLDEDYEQIPGYPMPGTTVFAGIKAEI